MTDGPVESARKWLSSQGYPLEMRAAKIFRDAGADVTASDHYVDPVTDKSREIDLVAFRHVVSHNQLALIVSAIIECKTLPNDKQWVGFDAGTYLPGRLIFGERVATPLGDAWMRRQSERHDLPVLQNAVRHVHGLTTTHQAPPERDSAYQAVNGAVHAAVARAKQWSSASQRPNDNHVAGIALPVVVVSGDLLVARLDDEHEMQIDPCDHLILSWREPVGGRDLTLVNVVTETALAQWARDFVTTATTLTSHTQPEAQAALTEAIDATVPTALYRSPMGKRR